MKPWEATKLIDVLDEMNLEENKTRDMVVEKLRKLSNKIFNISRKVLGDPAETHEKWVDNPDLINNVTDKIGRQCIVAAMDVKKEEENKWVVYTHGGRKKTSLDALTWAIELDKRGAGEILLTSMDRDGTKKGFDTNLLKTISNHVDIPVIASGGAGELEHLKDAIVLGNADAVLAASIFHYSIFSIKEVKDYFKDNGVMVRS